MASAFKKINDSIKVKELEDKNIFEVNGDWTFEPTKDIEFSPDAENEGFITGLLSLKGLYRNGRYMLDVTIGNHVNIFGQYFSIIDCKYDNRFSDDDSNSLQVVFADDDDFYVDLISYLEFFTSKVEIRVRGDEILACNLFMTINNLTQNEWKEVASVLKSIAGSIKLKKKSSQNKKSDSNKKNAKKISDDFIVEDTTLIKYIEHKALGFTYNERSDEDVPYKGIKIHGYNNSAAHVYAYDNGFDFVSLGESKNPITDELYNYDHLV